MLLFININITNTQLILDTILFTRYLNSFYQKIKKTPLVYNYIALLLNFML